MDYPIKYSEIPTDTYQISSCKSSQESYTGSFQDLDFSWHSSRNSPLFIFQRFFSPFLKGFRLRFLHRFFQKYFRKEEYPASPPGKDCTWISSINFHGISLGVTFKIKSSFRGSSRDFINCCSRVLSGIFMAFFPEFRQ